MKILKFNEGSHLEVPSKPILKGDVKTVIFIDSYDLEEFVREVYDLDYDFSDSSDSRVSRYSVTGDIIGSNKDKAYGIRNKTIGQKWISAGLLLNCLCGDGYIEPGTYVIE